MNDREAFPRAERKAIAANILLASSVKGSSIAASLGISPGMLSKWRSPDYDEAPSLDDLARLDLAAQTTILRERMCDYYGTPDRSQMVLRALRLNAQIANALETGDADFIDRLESAMTGSAA